MSNAANLIRQYLTLPSVEGLASHGQQKVETAEARLLEIPKALDALDARRREFAANLDEKSLQKLLLKLFEIHHLDPADLFQQSPNEEQEIPDEVRPAFDEWNKRIERGLENALISEKEKFESKLSEAKNFMGENWIDGPVDAREWIRQVIRVKNVSEKQIEGILRSWFDFVTVGDLLGQDDEFDDSKSNLDLATMKQYHDHFAIGDKLPSFLQGRFDSRYARRWPAGKFLNDLQKTIGLRTWGAFWTKFGSQYLEALEEQATVKGDLKKIRRSAGQAGSAERTKTRYINFVQSFLQSLKGRNVTLELISEFDKQDNVVEEKGRSLLRLLLNAKQYPSVYEDMDNLLKKDGINLNQVDAEECFDVLFHRKIPTPKKKAKK